MPILRVGNQSIHYEVEGEGPPLLLIHGHGASSAYWDLQVPAFASSYRVIRFDLRGHGDSDKPEGPYTIEAMAADAAGLLRELAPQKQAHVIGHSLGGGVALQLALAAPDKVRSLVIANSQASFVPRSLVERLVFSLSRVIPRLFGFRAHAKTIVAGYLPAPQHAERRARFLELWVKNDLQGYLRSSLGSNAFDIRSRLGEIKQPTLVIGSDQDILPQANKQELVEKMPNARLVTIKDSRHLVVWDQAEAFNRTVLDFLSGLGG